VENGCFGAAIPWHTPAPSLAAAQWEPVRSYPSRPIRMIVGAPAGRRAVRTRFARIVSPRLAEVLGPARS